jgi:hypothetical protein
MDAVEFEALKQKNVPSEHVYIIDRFITRAGEYTSSGAPVEISVSNEEDFGQILRLLDLEKVDASRILHYYATDTRTGASYDSQDTRRPLKLEGEGNVWGMLSSLIDRADYANEDSNYRSTIIIAIDDATSVAIGEEVMDVSSTHELEFVSKHWVALFNTADIEKFTDWRDWDLDQTYASERAITKAAHEAREIEREKSEGIMNLSRLKTGEVIKATDRKSVV